MQRSCLIVTALMLPIISTAPVSAAVVGLNDTVEFSLVTGHLTGEAYDPIVTSTFELQASVSIVDGAGSASFAGDAGVALSGVSITVDVSQVTPSTRVLTISLVSDDATFGFANPSTAVNGVPVDFIGYRFGAQAQDPFDDPDFTGITDSSGIVPRSDGLLGGDLFTYVIGGPSDDPSTHVIVHGTVWELGIARFDAQLTYTVVPAPSSALVLTVAFAGRRRVPSNASC